MNKKFYYKNYAGVSLIELMVSMAISLILMLGIANVYLGSKATYSAREDFGVLQELGRQVLETVTESIQMSDHWAGLPVDEITVGAVGTLTGVGSCNAAWISNVSQSVAGEDGAATASALGLTPDCLDGYVANSDVLILRYAGGSPVSDADVDAATDDLFVRAATDSAATLFAGASNSVSSTNIEVTNAARNYPYRVEVYYLHDCNAAATACSNQVPTLARLILSNNNLVTELLADGVEQIQYLYGVDADQDTVAERFVNAANVANWSQVVAVKVDMLVRTISEDHSYSDANSYDLAGGSTAAGGLQYTPGANAQAYHRKQFSKLVQIRNRVRG